MITGGRIMNVASIAGKQGNPKVSAFSAVKAGVIAFTKSWGSKRQRKILLSTVICQRQSTQPYSAKCQNSISSTCFPVFRADVFQVLMRPHRWLRGWSRGKTHLQGELCLI